MFLAGAGLLILHGFAWLFWYLLFPDEQFFWGFFMEAVLLIVMAAVAGCSRRARSRRRSRPCPTSRSPNCARRRTR